MGRLLAGDLFDQLQHLPAEEMVFLFFLRQHRVPDHLCGGWGAGGVRGGGVVGRVFKVV